MEAIVRIHSNVSFSSEHVIETKIFTYLSHNVEMLSANANSCASVSL